MILILVVGLMFFTHMPLISHDLGGPNIDGEIAVPLSMQAVPAT
jgi:hypothetical protein